MSRPTLLFFHGLNTFGDDQLHVGPATFGPMHGPLETAFDKAEFDFHPVLGLAAVPPEDQAAQAAERLTKILSSAKSSFHLLGHSTGGLTARVFAHRPEVEGRIRSVITVGTPHRGALPAEFALSFHQQSPVLYRLFRTFGYDTRRKLAIFASYTAEALAQFNKRWPDLDDVRYASALNEIGLTSLSWPLRPMYRWFHPMDVWERSDGFISSESQRWGENLGTFGLDHFGGLGFAFQPTSRERQRARSEFRKMVQAIAAYCRAAQSD